MAPIFQRTELRDTTTRAPNPNIRLSHIMPQRRVCIWISSTQVQHLVWPLAHVSLRVVHNFSLSSAPAQSPNHNSLNIKLTHSISPHSHNSATTTAVTFGHLYRQWILLRMCLMLTPTYPATCNTTLSPYYSRPCVTHLRKRVHEQSGKTSRPNALELA